MMKYEKGALLFAALAILGTVAATTAEFLDTMTSGYNESRRKMWSNAFRRSPTYKAVKETFEQLEQDLRSEQRLRQLLSRLSKDGLVVRGENEASWKLTVHGRERYAALVARASTAPTYRAVPSKQTVIVAFDIPERERRKREWLREALRNLGLRKLQQSLWVGNVAIPAVFLEDLDRLKLIPCVQLFAVTRSGTLRKLR